MEKRISGIHHITALASDPQQNINFYSGVLGLRFIKKTVNFDAPDVYHLYYGNETGDPGTILTFFPYEGLIRGLPGNGMVNVIGFSVPKTSQHFWQERLSRFRISFSEIKNRFDQESFITLHDPDGLELELVFNDDDMRKGFTYGSIPPAHSIRGFHHIEIQHEDIAPTAQLLTDHMDHDKIVEIGNRSRFAATNQPGHLIDLVIAPEQNVGQGGGGSVHHIAFLTPDEDTQFQSRDKIRETGLHPTSVIDRQYFKSVYFREPGGVLFEIATHGPGFEVDETKEHLGEELKLPPQYEPYRNKIEMNVKPVHLNLKDYH